MDKKLEHDVIFFLNKLYVEKSVGFLDFLTDDVVWYGPFDSHNTTVGKEALRRMLERTIKKYTFNIENLQTDGYFQKRDACTLVVRYRLVCRSESEVFTYNQHMVLALKRVPVPGSHPDWRCCMLHVSDTMIRGDEGRSDLSPNELELVSEMYSQKQKAERIAMHAEGGGTVFIPADDIVFIEAAKGVKCTVHTVRGEYRINSLIKDILQPVRENFLRCHASFIVNLDYAEQISDGKIILSNSDAVPVPAKKLSEVKKAVTEYFRKKNEG